MTTTKVPKKEKNDSVKAPSTVPKRSEKAKDLYKS